MYRILYRLLASLARLTVRSGRSKELEIIVLRHQLAVLRRQIDRVGAGNSAVVVDLSRCGPAGPWPTRLLGELLTSGEPQREEGDRQTDQPLAPQPSQCNGPRRTRRGHQRPDPRLVQLLRGLLPPASCMPSQRASTNILSDGRCRSSNDCEANPPKHGDGSTLPVSASHNSSPTGTSSPQPHAGLREPYDGRLSRTVLTEREGEVPSRHSPPSRRACFRAPKRAADGSRPRREPGWGTRAS